MQAMIHETASMTHPAAIAAHIAAPVAVPIQPPTNQPANLVADLERIREATLELRLMQAEYHAMQPAPQTPRLDGMPRGGNGAGAAAADSVARLIDARSLLAGRIRQNGEALAHSLEQVRPRLDALPAHLFTFCLHYYVNAVPIAEVALIMQRDRKTVYEYKKKLAAYV